MTLWPISLSLLQTLIMNWVFQETGGFSQMQLPTSGYLTLDRLILVGLLLVSMAGHVAKFISERKAGIHETQTKAIASYKNAYDAQTLELQAEKALLLKTQEELDEVSEELKTLVGIDTKLLLDFAREGYVIENKRLEKEIQRLMRRSAG